MSNLLFINSLVGEEFTEWVTLGATALLALTIVAVCVLLLKRKLGTTDIVYAGVALATSFVLSFIKVAPVQYGGSITLASLVPLIVYTYFFGFTHGLLTGLIYGLLQFIQSPYILTPATFILDYLLAFGAICMAGVVNKIKNQKVAILTSGCLVYAVRFLMHFISGIIYFNQGAIWVNLPADSAVVYSFLYQTVYLIPDLAICLIVLGILISTKTIDRLRPKSITQK